MNEPESPAPPAPIPTDPAPPPAAPISRRRGRIVLLLLGLAFASALLKVPYVITMVFEDVREIFPLALGVVMEGSLTFVAACAGLAMRERLGLPPPWIAARSLGQAPAGSWKRLVLWGLPAGVAAGLAVMAVFERAVPIKEAPHTSAWQDVPASLGAGVGEEMFDRLGVLTLFAWLGTKLWRQPASSVPVFWVANLLAGVIFALGHLPLTELDFFVTLRIMSHDIATSLLVGLLCGWLYWRFDLLSAMVAHATYDVVVTVPSWF